MTSCYVGGQQIVHVGHFKMWVESSFSFTAKSTSKFLILLFDFDFFVMNL